VTAAARKPPVGEPVVLAEEIPRADPVEVFRLRCASRAKLWHTGQIDLHSAVDELQYSAEASGLIEAIGQDAVQGLMVEAFAPLRDDLPHNEKPPADDTFAESCRRADEKQRRKSPDPRLDRLRRLMDDDVSIERAWHELKAERGREVPEVVLQAAVYLVQQGDADRWKKWFDSRSPEERAAILQHLEQRKGRLK
jgi:hypothetical protein